MRRRKPWLCIVKYSFHLLLSTGAGRLFVTLKAKQGSLEYLLITLSPIKRRIVYVTIFELIGILFATRILMAISAGDLAESLPVAVMVSTAAVVWNFIYNTGFEAWEFRNKIVDRTFKIRSIHALGFEAGLFMVCLPLYMLWYGVGVWTALTMEVAILFFFLVYTFVFTLLFDQIFTRHTYEGS